MDEHDKRAEEIVAICAEGTELTGEPATWHEDGRLVCYVDPGKLRRLLTATVTPAPSPATDRGSHG